MNTAYVMMYQWVLNDTNNSLATNAPLPDKCSPPITPGKIVIHDRKLVEEEVLPIYFNHKSFASLRRQLSYFSFVRVGKSSRGKVIYSNDAVFEIADILKLKRRGASAEKKAQDQQQQRSQREQYQDRQNQHIMMATSSDVASAVNSGMLNAAKANDKLESMKDCPQPAVTSAYCRISSTTHSSLSASSDNEVATKKVANSYNKKKRSSSVQKYKLRRKDRARLKKMLYYNKIVPFIHFSSMPNLVEVDTNSRGGGNKRDSRTGPGESLARYKKKRSNTNETAINALLSLGAP